MYVRRKLLSSNHYGRMKPSAERLDGTSAILTLHPLGLSHSPKQHRHTVQRIGLGTLGEGAVVVTLAILGATELAELLQRLIEEIIGGLAGTAKAS
jgi:hypothetical protein